MSSTGAWMGGRRGAVLMQTSGFGTIPNALASLVVPYQIPAIMFVSERGTLGEFNLGQAMVCRTMRPVLEFARGRAPHHHPPRRARVHRRPLDQAGRGHPGAGRLHPVAAAHRRQSVREVRAPMSSARRPQAPRRRELRQRQGGQPLRADQAPRRQAREGRGRDRRRRQHQFRPVVRRAPAAEFLHARQHGPRRSRSRSGSRSRSPTATSSRSKATARC